MRIGQIIIGLALAAFLTAGASASGKPAASDVKNPQAVAGGKISDAALSKNAADKATEDAKALRQIFLNGYDDYTRGRYLKACSELYRFLSRTTPDDTDNDWATFFFGISLKKAGFSHAAVDTLVNLVIRKPNTKIVSYSLELLEDISRNMPFDHELLIDTAVCDESYNFVEGNVADFVNYYQGKYDWDRGLFAWGDKHFESIRKDSYYYDKYLFESGLRRLYAGQTDAAISNFKEVLGSDAASEGLRNDARKTLARLYYEVGRYKEADFLYQQIDMNIVEQAQNLLERAWVHYRMGNPQRAMGLLYSFEAPSFKNSFTPEFYILKSFIYKDVCYYRKAMTVLADFNDRYGGALSKIYARETPRDNEQLLLVILNNPRVKQTWKFLSLLEKEQGKCRGFEDKALSTYLVKLYRLKRDAVERRLRREVEKAYEDMANDLLQYEEEAHLMEYEIGLDMYQRVSEVHYSEDKKSDKESSESNAAVYEFQGEFWNDELDHYSVSLPDKCQKAEEWEIFFK